MSHFSSWNCHTLTTRRSPSRIHMRFFSLPGMRPSRLLPSLHITRMRDAPRSWSAMPMISPSLRRGIRTRTTSSSGTAPKKRSVGLNVSHPSLHGIGTQLRFEPVRGCRLRGDLVDLGLVHRDVRVGRERVLEERAVDDVHALGELVLLVVHMAEPVHDRAVAEELAV